MLEATPNGVTATSGGLAARKLTRSSWSAGWKIAAAGPPTRSQVRAASGTCARSRPRTGGS